MEQADKEVQQEAEELLRVAESFTKILAFEESKQFKEKAKGLIDIYNRKLETLEADNLQIFHMRAVKLQAVLQVLRILVEMPEKYIDAKQNAETFLKDNKEYFEAKI